MEIGGTELQEIKRRIGEKILEQTKDMVGISGELREALSLSPTVNLLERLTTFKINPWFYEIKTALQRIENGMYGQCMICSHLMSLPSLEKNPTRRMCTDCVHNLKLKGFEN